MRRWNRVLGGLAAAALVISGCGQAATSGPPAPSRAPASATPHPRPPVPVGVYQPGEDGSWSAVSAFSRQAGQPVSYVLNYLGPADPFPAQLGEQAASNHAEPVLQLEPSMSMQQVAAGQDDAYLESLAAEVADYGHPVILSWAAEANGNWYSWGFTHTPASQYRAAWAHVMDVFRGAHNVTWMDTINRVYPGAGPTADYLVPGVSMYGIDAYYNYPGDTFSSVFGPTIAQIRAVTNLPILINETAIGQVNDQVRDIPALVSGVRDSRLEGFIWFNANQGAHDMYHQNWELTPAGAVALRSSLAATR